MGSLLTLFNDVSSLPGPEFPFTAKMLDLPRILKQLGATYTRNSLKTVIQDGALVQLTNNQFGTSYDPVTGMYGYMPEPAATNELTYSVNFSNAAWALNDGVKTSTSAAAPDGTNTALVLMSTGTYSHLRRALTSSSAARTISIFFKKDPSAHQWWRFMHNNGAGSQAQCWFDMKNAVLGNVEKVGNATGVSALITHIGGDWYRISVSGTVENSTIMQISPQANNGSAIFVSGAVGTFWFGQCESGMRATSPIYTTGATAARAADILTVPLANIAGFNSAAYTLFVDGRYDVIDASQTRFAAMLDNGTNNNRAQLASATTYDAAVYSGSTVQSTQSTALTISRLKSGLSLQSNSAKVSFNGTSATEDTSVSMPVNINTLRIGAYLVGTLQFNGYIYRVALINRALTQAQLNAITT